MKCVLIFYTQKIHERILIEQNVYNNYYQPNNFPKFNWDRIRHTDIIEEIYNLI